MSNIESYTFEVRDSFKREQVANKIITLLDSSINVSPLLVDGSWGVGKTEFCKKLINKMEKSENNHLIYIDAFKSDHANEPLLTVLAAVLDILPDNENKKALRKNVLPVLRYGLKVGGKALLSHVFKQDSETVAEGLEKEINKAAEKAIDASVDSLLQDHIDSEKNLTALQNTLKEVAKDKPIILFIDELDRCRPDFAVLMLETIKHVFDINNVKFVLITNTKQLKATINHCYGSSVDAQRYLDKFIKFSFTLSNYNNHTRELTSVQHYKELICKSEQLKDQEIDKDACLNFIENIIKHNEISLREVETIIRYLEIYNLLTSERLKDTHWFIKLIHFSGVIIATLKPNIAKSIINNNIDAKEIGDFFGFNSIPWINENSIGAIETLLYFYTQQAKYNVKDFTTTTEQELYFNKWIKGLFSCSYYNIDDKNQMSELMKSSIEKIHLDNIL